MTGTIVALLALQFAAISAVAVGFGAAGFIVTMVGFSATPDERSADLDQN
ncbi:hypothetical protein BH24CHL10_BH24CHL10_12580 [soil metagenome]